jgi:phosphoglycerol transferase
VFIGFIGFVAVGAWLSGWWRERSTRVAWALAGLLVLVGAFDQSAEVLDAAAWDRQASWESDSEFVGRIEALLPDGAMVFQVPYVPFPGHPDVERMRDYDLFKGYLHSTDLRWSYGAMRGRVPEWQPPLLARDAADVIAGLVAVGFEGLYIDRFAYADSGAALESSFGEYLGQEPIVSNDERLAFFDLRAAALELRSRLTETEIEALARETLMSDAVTVP